MRWVILLVFLASGCASGLAKVKDTLPVVAKGVHVATQTGHDVLHPLCKAKAEKCRANGVTDRNKCPGWMKCDSVRVALEEVARAMEDDVAGLKSKIEAFEKVQKAINELKEE